MGMPAIDRKVWTSDDVRRMRDEKEQRPFEKFVRYEVVDGELQVTPAPRPVHQRAVQLLHRLVDAYVEAHRIGWTLVVAADVELDPVSNVQPDLLVAPWRDGRFPREWSELGNLLLVVEVLSPSTARFDRTRKRLRYQRAGIPEYWIADVDARLVERWRPSDDRPEILTGELTWQPEASTALLAIDLPALFAAVWQDESSAEGRGPGAQG